ncbi:MAG: hypothetical protein IGNPGNKH_00399 [Sodalis sp. Ffu]|nr:MAG: hypothetical protein CMIDDMOC_00555 [Sodalis sp. Fle]UVK78929.1 MAG: hypothetical protein IGNPGNKH_00399 [Sodalis sp. Ffu]
MNYYRSCFHGFLPTLAANISLALLQRARYFFSMFNPIHQDSLSPGSLFPCVISDKTRINPATAHA